MDDELLNEVATARFLNTAPRTLEAWRYKGTGPAFIRVGRAIRYRRSDLEAWLNMRRVDYETESMVKASIS